MKSGASYLIEKQAFELVSWDDILHNNKQIDFIMSDEQIKQLLEKVGNPADENGYIYDENTKEKVNSIENEEIKYNEIGAVLSCCKIFVKKKLVSYSHYLSKFLK